MYRQREPTPYSPSTGRERGEEEMKSGSEAIMNGITVRKWLQDNLPFLVLWYTNILSIHTHMQNKLNTESQTMTHFVQNKEFSRFIVLHLTSMNPALSCMISRLFMYPISHWKNLVM